MRKTSLIALTLAVSFLAAGVAVAEQSASRDRSAECDRACLEGFVNKYLDALAARDPGRLPLADNVVFVENQQVLKLGDGLWRTVTGLGHYRHYFADPEMGQAGLIGVIEESGKKIILTSGSQSRGARSGKSKRLRSELRRICTRSAARRIRSSWKRCHPRNDCRANG